MDTSYTYLHDQGVVIKKNIGTYHVRTDGRVLPCAISPRLRKQLIYPIAAPTSLSHIVRDVKILDKVDPVAVGDDPQTFFAVFDSSFRLDTSTQARLDTDSIRALDAADRNMVRVQLFGHELELAEMLFQNSTVESV